MVHWDDFRFILALHRHGTMTAAAAALKTNVATVSRRIERTGEDLGTPIFHKENGAWQVTPIGLKFIKIAEDFEAEVSREENNLASGQAGGQAKITIQAPPVILASILLPALPQLMASMPGLQMTFLNKLATEGLGEADLLLRWGRPEHGRLIARKVGAMTFRAYSGGGADHKGWVSFGRELDETPPGRMGRRLFKEGPRVRTSHIDHKVEVMRSIGLAGVIPEIVGDAAPGLTRMQAPFDESMSLDFWYGFHISRRDDATLRSVVNWVCEAFTKSELRGIDVADNSPEIKVG